MADTKRTQRILILFAHPALEKSRVHRHLRRAGQGIDDVTFHDLYEVYPDFDIEVEREQQLLTEHDQIVLQYPLFWFSTPSILKEWQDLVLEHGWAFGTEGKALRGKKLLVAVSTGGGEEAYRPEGFNRFTMQDFLAPLRQMASGT